MTWSSDGKSGSRYFQADGKHFLEVQELVPVADGKYEIVKKVVETTPPTTPQHSHLSRVVSQDNSPIQYDDTWFEPPGQTFYPKLFFSPHQGWREMTEEEMRRLNSIRPLSEYDPLLTAPVDRLPEQNRVPLGDGSYMQNGDIIDSAGNYVNPVVERRVDHLGRTWTLRDGRWHLHPNGGSADQGWGHPQHQERPPTSNHEHQSPAHEQPSYGHPTATASHPHHASRADSGYSDEVRGRDHAGRTWILRGGQWHPVEDRGYSGPYHIDHRAPAGAPHEVRPLPHDVHSHAYPAGGGSPGHQHPGSPGGASHSDLRRVDNTGREWLLRDGQWHLLSHHGGNVRASSETQSSQPVREWQESSTPRSEDAQPIRHGDWVLRDGTWYYQPRTATYNPGQWVFRDGQWHFQQPGSVEKRAPVATEVAGAGGYAESGHLVNPVAKVQSFPFHGHGESKQKLVEKAVHVEDPEQDVMSKENETDYSSWFYSYYDQGTTAETALERPDDAQELSEGSGGSAHFIQDDLLGTLVFPEQDDSMPGNSHSSYFIRDGNVGAMVYTEGEGDSEGEPRIPLESTDGGHNAVPPQLLSVDEFRRLQPSEHGLVPLKDAADLLSCGDSEGGEENGEYWMLRTQPCGEDSPEGRILLPNGEVLKFYGHPQLVKA